MMMSAFVHTTGTGPSGRSNGPVGNRVGTHVQAATALATTFPEKLDVLVLASFEGFRLSGQPEPPPVGRSGMVGAGGPIQSLIAAVRTVLVAGSNNGEIRMDNVDVVSLFLACALQALHPAACARSGMPDVELIRATQEFVRRTVGIGG
jgi:hypothetical protein